MTSNHGKRLEALEGRGGASKPREIELVVGPTMSRAESDALPPLKYVLGQVVTKIELIGVRA